MGQLYTKVFWADTFERAISTAAQSILLVLGLGSSTFEQIADVNLIANVNLTTLLFAGVGGFLLSIIKALAAAQIGSKDSASFIG